MKVTFLLHEPVRDEFIVSFPKSLPWVPEVPSSHATNWRLQARGVGGGGSDETIDFY